MQHNVTDNYELAVIRNTKLVELKVAPYNSQKC